MRVFTRMNMLREMNHQEENGFTLIELIIIVVISGILALIAVPIFINQQKTATDAILQSDLKTLS